MRRTVLLLAVILAVGGCDSQTTSPANTASTAATPQLRVTAARQSAGTDVLQDLAALRQVTARFHNLSAANDAGYTTVVADPNTGETCVSMPPDGAMGIHYLNGTLVSANPVVSKPPIVIYEPERNGQMHLVGVEYIIPYTIHRRDADPPELFGHQQFLQNDTFGLWMLHAWVWRHNPSGMFATWNPKVTCSFAPAPAP